LFQKLEIFRENNVTFLSEYRIIDIIKTKTMKATHRLIDSVWTVEYNILSPTEVEILKFGRDDPEGYEKERQLPQCNVVEDDKRTFVALQVRDSFDSFKWVNAENCDREYKVVNPKHIFSY